MLWILELQPSSGVSDWSCLSQLNGQSFVWRDFGGHAGNEGEKMCEQRLLKAIHCPRAGFVWVTRGRPCSKYMLVKAWANCELTEQRLKKSWSGDVLRLRKNSAMLVLVLLGVECGSGRRIGSFLSKECKVVGYRAWKSESVARLSCAGGGGREGVWRTS